MFPFLGSQTPLVPGRAPLASDLAPAVGRRGFHPASFNGRLVGRLRREAGGAVDFHYGSWLGWNNAIPVSISLPLREDRYIGASVLAVFENLLPDHEAIRRRLAERSKAEGSNVCSLLAAVGCDCVGALHGHGTRNHTACYRGRPATKASSTRTRAPLFTS
jgi:HipA-like protein